MRASSAPVAAGAFAMTTLALGLITGLIAAPASAQSTSDSPLAPPPNGMTRTDPRVHVLMPDLIQVAPGRTIQDGAVVIADGRISRVLTADQLAAASWPRAYVEHDLEGLTVYPGLIDAFVETDAPMPDPSIPGSHHISDVTPHRSALDGSGLSDADKKTLREQGFTAAAISPATGIARPPARINNTPTLNNAMGTSSS